MATITINIPSNADLNLIVDAFADVYNYADATAGDPNPVTKAQFAKLQVIQFIRNVVAGYKEKAYIRDLRQVKAEGIASGSALGLS